MLSLVRLLQLDGGGEGLASGHLLITAGTRDEPQLDTALTELQQGSADCTMGLSSIDIGVDEPSGWVGVAWGN